MNVHNLKQLTLIELHSKLLELTKEQFNLQLQLRSGKLHQIHLIKKVRLYIAQVKTIFSEKVKKQNI
ncbi:MAG: 50S ribosomal protein L29 [Buchnera aphidicola (Eriosoma harunire)]